MYEYRCRVTKVVDGDTLHLDIDLGLDVHTNVTVRLLGVDCAEAWTPGGKAAKAWVEQMIGLELLPLVVRTHKDSKEKFGRYLAELLMGDGRVLNEELVKAGLARPYDGGKRIA